MFTKELHGRFIYFQKASCHTKKKPWTLPPVLMFPLTHGWKLYKRCPSHALSYHIDLGHLYCPKNPRLDLFSYVLLANKSRGSTAEPFHWVGLKLEVGEEANCSISFATSDEGYSAIG